MKKHGNAHTMHLLMIALFIVMIFVAYTRIRFIMRKRRVKKPEPFTSHVIEQTKIAHIKNAQTLALKAMSRHNLSEPLAIEIANIKTKIDTIAKQYLNPSPALAFLGPIGTAGVIMKEDRLEQELIALLAELSTILSGKTKKYASLKEALKGTKKSI